MKLNLVNVWDKTMDFDKTGDSWTPTHHNFEDVVEYYQQMTNGKTSFLSYLYTDDLWAPGHPWITEDDKPIYLSDTKKALEEIDYHFDDSDIDILANVHIGPHSDKGSIEKRYTAFFILKANDHELCCDYKKRKPQRQVKFNTGDILIVDVHAPHAVILPDERFNLLSTQEGTKKFVNENQMVGCFFDFNPEDNLTKEDIENKFMEIFEHDMKPRFTP